VLYEPTIVARVPKRSILSLKYSANCRGYGRLNACVRESLWKNYRGAEFAEDS
jgi:hypothetical protein